MIESRPLTLIVQLSAEQLDAIARVVGERLAVRSSSDSTPTWLDTFGAAAYIACKVGRIHDLVQLGKLKPRRDGRRLLFRREELDDYLERSA